MAKRPTITTVASGYTSQATIDANFEAVRDQFDNTLSRDGSTPNEMGADLDLNSNDILNAGTVNTDNLVVGGTNLDSKLDEAAASATASAASATASASSASASAASASAAATSETNAAASAVEAALYDPTTRYETVADLLAATDTFPVDTYVQVVDGDHTYKVVASSGHVQNSAGSPVQFDVIPETRGYNVKAFGAVGDGTTDDTSAIQAALNVGGDVLIPKSSNDYVVSSTLTLKADRQSFHGEGFGTQFKFTGSTVFLDSDGWPAPDIRFFTVYSTGGTKGIRIGPDSGLTRYSHWWRLDSVMVIGNTPNWASTSLCASQSGFSTSGIEIETCFYGQSNACEVSYCTGRGFLLKNQANGNQFVGLSARDNTIGLSVHGSSSTNGNRFDITNIESAFSGNSGIEVLEADRNIFSGRMECSAGGGAYHVKVSPTTGVARDNSFIGLQCTGTDAGYVLGDGTGTSEVTGTMIVGGRPGTSITINSDCNSTFVQYPGSTLSGVTINDTGHDTVMWGDPNSTDQFYMKAGVDAVFKLLATTTDLTIDSGAEPMILKAGNATRMTLRDDGLVQVPGNLIIGGGDQGGLAGHLALTSSENTGTARSTGVGTVKFADATNRDSSGFLQIRIGTSAYFIPVFNSN